MPVIPFLIIFKLFYVGSFPNNQTDIIYFDKNWQPVSKKEMVYYTLPPEPSGSKYLFKDYYKSGKLYFEALSTSKTEKKFDGVAKFYAENGQLIESAVLKNGIINGEVNSFDENGKVKGKAVYLNNKEVHALMFYYKGDTEGSPDYDTALKTVREKLTVEIIFDGDIKGIRKETYFKDKIVKSYDAEGKLIGTAKLNKADPNGNVLDYLEEADKPIEGTVVDYLYNPMRVNTITHLKKEKTTNH
ncbi:toxin-antitoxin system YwqK family antitoxin [Chryseobacterium sp. SIMBA_029]|uniref:toxin-antitoxin system YwqK family antitoxin n=1 Tax=Chryseobacterium sp. SIMBA_029 TaxID=3085772 RepID=UPI003979BCC7